MYFDEEKRVAGTTSKWNRRTLNERTVFKTIAFEMPARVNDRLSIWREPSGWTTKWDNNNNE